MRFANTNNSEKGIMPFAENFYLANKKSEKIYWKYCFFDLVH